MGASVRGTSHERAGQPCQDAHAYRVTPAGVGLIAVADGAGTAERSADGARLAVEAALEALEAGLDLGGPGSLAGIASRLMAEAFARARQAVADLAAAEGLPARAFATTLACAFISSEALAVGQVGDGLAVVAWDEADWQAALLPRRGEYANETAFITQPDGLETLQVRVLTQPARALVMMTDGLIRLAMDVGRGEPHGPFFKPFLAFGAEVAGEAEGQAQLAAFLASERVCARTDDDKTLVLAVRPPELEQAA